MTIAGRYHHPAAEAADVAGIDYEARVLEPSPPAVLDDDFFAEDAADPASASGRPVVTPHSGGDLTWDDLIAEHPEIAEFATARWLGARRELPQLPADFPSARADFHRLAYGVVAEARRIANGKFGLRFTQDGFGTPFFADNRQVRIAGNLIVVQQGDAVSAAPISTLRAAADFVGIEPGTKAAEKDSPELGDINSALDARSEVGEFLGEWFGLATAALEELRHTPGAHEPDRVQLWPGHFDPAIAVGHPDVGQKAFYGFSPGDRVRNEPYIYVSCFTEPDYRDPFWNEKSFSGALLGLRDLLESDDHYGAALAFLRGGYDRLHA